MVVRSESGVDIARLSQANEAEVIHRAKLSLRRDEAVDGYVNASLIYDGATPAQVEYIKSASDDKCR